MAKNPLFELSEAGTSVWLDYIRRSLITSGELQRMIEDDAVVGMTSNPTIFEKAIGGSSDYDQALRNLIDGDNKSDEEIMLGLIVEDIQMAADVLKPVYDRTKHKDGYVSIEVLPRVANDTTATITMAHDLWERVSRPNIFVKIPATDEGLPAIEQCIADRVNINITLMFSVKVYEDIARAYIRGLQRRAKAGKPVDIASVASFFVSRVDTSVDKLLEQKIAAASNPAERQRLQNLLGRAAVANAKLGPQGALRGGIGASAWADSAAVSAGIPDLSEAAIAATSAYCAYIYRRYGRFPAYLPPIHTISGFQVAHLDTEFYDRYYRPEALSATQRQHLARWHADEPQA